jgi:transcriptional regulator with XRE-family HTH domain
VANFDLGTYLKNARDRMRLSMQDLEERSKKGGSRTSVTASQVSRIETNQVHPRFQTLQTIAAALDLPLVIILDGGETEPKTVTILSTDEVAQSLVAVLHHEDVVELLIYCLELTEEQRKAILEVARSIRGFTRPLENSSEATQE